jgi:hypothetical protein
MATTTPNFGWPVPTSTDLVKDGATAIEALGDGIDTSLVDLKGGTTGQVLAKATSADMDFAWVAQDDSNAIQNAIVDAKGDLIAATANDTPARLAVGANGETLVADSSTATGLRYNPQNALANPVINGGFDIWQRGTSVAVGTAFTYGPDRWQGYRSGLVAGLTLSRQVTGDTTNLPNIQYAMRIQRDSGNSSIASLAIGQSFESVNSIPFAGKTVTLTFYARVGADYSGGSTFNVGLTSGTGTDQNINTVAYTGAVTVTNPTPTLTTSWQRFSGSGTVAATATELAITAFYTPSGTAGADDWVEITGVQIDFGTYFSGTAPTFRRTGGTIQGELAACQRYYWRTADLASSSAWMSTGLAITTSSVYFGVQYPVQMRVKPTVLDYAFPNVTLAATGYSGGTLTQVANGANANTSSISYNHTSAALTVDKIYLCGLAGNGYIGFGAEL